MNPGQRPESNPEQLRFETPEGTEAASEQHVSGDALREIVAQTESAMAQPTAAEPALREAMLEVARRYAGQPITVDPVGTALMEAILRVQIGVLETRPALLTRTARRAATTLLADPEARLRVENLWIMLCEGEA